MSRTLFAAAALALGLLATAPALAQPPAAGATEDSTAARTMAQNRRVQIGQPAPAAAAQSAVRERTAARPAPQASPSRRVELADGSGGRAEPR